MKIKIEKIVRNNDNKSRLKAIATVVLNDSIKISAVKIIESEHGLFPAMPFVSVNDKINDICHPTNMETNAELRSAILNAYNNNIFEFGETEEFHVTDLKIYKMDKDNYKARVSILLNNKFAIKFCNIVDITKSNENDLKLDFELLKNKNGEPFVSIISDSLKEEIINKSFEAYKATNNSEYKSEASRKQYERRQKNNSFIKSLGIECYEDLPLVESSESVKLKTLDEICNRAFACYFAIQVACDINNNNYEESINYFKPKIEAFQLTQYLNSKEKRIIDGTYTKQDAIDLDWAYEALWSLFYALGLIEDISNGGVLCNCDFIIKTMSSCKNIEEFKNKCRLRDIEEILDMLDLYYRYDWACTEKRLRPETAIANLNPSNVIERRRGLEWLISKENDWYEISLDT